MISNKFILLIWGLFNWTVSISGQRHWTAADGLPTGEIRQIVELPNGQMLVNCEGVFCILMEEVLFPLEDVGKYIPHHIE